jgi:23S rRNA (adenine2503-C2)-methyltransferase
MMNIFEYTYRGLVGELGRRYGKGAYHAAVILRRLYHDMNTDIAGCRELADSREFAARLAADIDLETGRVTHQEEQDQVVKFVTRFADGQTVESVVLSMVHHKTVCVSSQAGCRMGCRFCETGQKGLARNLAVAEIVGQVFNARRKFGPEVRNVVFMGMGEPFDNYDNVFKAIDVVCDQRGLDIARRRITVSTAGLAEGLRKFGASGPPLIKLAISLNAPNDRLRSELMPVNRSLPLDKLKALLRAFPLKKKYYFLFAYVQIPGVNDQPEHAVQLAGFLESLPSKVNLIPFNPGSKSPYRAPSEEESKRFRELLIARRVNVQQRSTRGRELMAACGQLGSAVYPL